jgi:hypothetical protein
MLVFSAPKLLFGAMDVDNWTMLHWWIEADAELQERIKETARRFWEYVEAGTLPPQEEPEPVELPEGTAPEDVYQAGEDWDLAVASLREAYEIFKQAEVLKKQRVEEFKAAMGKHRTLVQRGGTFHHLPTKGRRTFQQKQAQSEYERLAALAGVEAPGWETFFKPGLPGSQFRAYFREVGDG